MSNGLNKRKKPVVVDFEAKASEQRKAREKNVSEQINKDLADGKCEFVLYAWINENTKMRLGDIFKLGVSIEVESK